MSDEEIPEVEINVLVEPVGGTKPRTVKFMVYETLEDGSEPDYDAEVLANTEEADRYRSAHMVPYEPPDQTGFLVLPVLDDLWGEPWDRCTLNFVHSLRPSSIRVVGPGGVVTCDARPWRVSVFLENNDRTILKIEQEVEVGCIGAKHGHGLRRYVLGEDPEPVLGYFNPRGLERLELTAEEEGHHPDTSPAGRALLNQAADEHLMEILNKMESE